MPTPWKEVAALLPDELKELLPSDGAWMDRVEELRVRSGRPMQLKAAGWAFLSARPVEPMELKHFADNLMNHSVYAWEEQLLSGYLTLKNGCRVGLSGRFGVRNGEICALQQIFGLNVRMARAFEGVANGILPFLSRKGRFLSTLILSAPGMGKTSLLRDLCRAVSDELGQTVCVADERGEIAGSWQGAPCFRVGLRTDVMEGVPKAQAMRMMTRSMSPEVLVTDELGDGTQADAAMEALMSGIALAATAHAGSFFQAKQKPGLARLMEAQAFERVVILSGRPGNVEAILDGRGQAVRREASESGKNLGGHTDGHRLFLAGQGDRAGGAQPGQGAGRADANGSAASGKDAG